MKTKQHWLLVMILFQAGCISPARVSLTRSSLQHRTGAYKIVALNSDNPFISRAWRIVNWTYNKRSEEYDRKSGPLFQGKVRVDVDEDGSDEIENTYFYDLELKQKRTDSEIWVYSRGLLPREKGMNLEVFLESYAEGLSGEDRRSIVRGGRKSIKTKTYATKIESKRVVSFGPYKALIAKITMANLDQLRLNPSHRYGVVELVLVKLNGDFEHIYRKGMKLKTTRGLLEIGFFSSPGYFEGDRPDFYKFLNQFSFADQKVSVEPPTPKIPADASPLKNPL